MKQIKSFFLLLILLVGSVSVSLAQNKINRVEPPNWWVGMNNPDLQLLIHGNNITNLQPSLSYPGVRIERIIKVENPNYLFVNLKIDDTAKPGKFDLQFKNGNQIADTYSYELRARRADSAMREGFKPKDVMYLITPDRFVNGNPNNDNVAGLRERANRDFKGGRHGGDIQGIINSLDYLEDMGFTAIWLNPVLENDMVEYSYHGYSTTDFYKVDPRFGTNEDYVGMSRLAKEKGIKIIMDMIVNHCGSYHWWMNDKPTDDWINEPVPGQYTQTIHKKTVIQDPHVSKIDHQYMLDGWFVETMPDLNQRNELMANYLIQNSIWWVEYADLGGIRMDTYPYADKQFLTDWSCAIMNEYPDFNIVGEEWFGNPAILAYWQKGKNSPDGYESCLPSLMDFPLQEQMWNSLAPESSTWMPSYEMLAMDFLYPDPFNLVTFPDNHDMDRFYTRVGENLALFKLGIAYTLTMRGIPQIYYGTETLLTNTGYPGDHGIIRTDFPGGWAGDPVNAFTGAGLSADQQEAMAFIKKMLNWRKNAAVVHDGKLTHFMPKNGVYVYFRYNADEKLMVVLNQNEEAQTLDLKHFAEMLHNVSGGQDVISGKSYEFKDKLTVPAKTPLVLELK